MSIIPIIHFYPLIYLVLIIGTVKQRTSRVKDETQRPLRVVVQLIVRKISHFRLLRVKFVLVSGQTLPCRSKLPS